MSDDPENLPITVRRAVLTAAERMIKEAASDKRGLTDWNLAEEQRDAFREQANNEMADFWHEVYQYLMELEARAADTPINIIE